MIEQSDGDVIQISANYVCPRCRGGFEVWGGSINNKKCPFCGLKQGDYRGY